MKYYMKKCIHLQYDDLENILTLDVHPYDYSVRTLEKAKATGNFAVESGELHVENNSYHDSNSSASDLEADAVPRQKKIKTKKF